MTAGLSEERVWGDGGHTHTHTHKLKGGAGKREGENAISLSFLNRDLGVEDR